MIQISARVRAKHAIGIGSLLAPLLLVSTVRSAAEPTAVQVPTIRRVRTLEADGGVLKDPAGLVHLQATGGFLVIESSPPGEADSTGTRIVRISPHGQEMDSTVVSWPFGAPTGFAADPRHGRLIVPGDDPGTLMALGIRSDGTLSTTLPSRVIVDRPSLTRIDAMTIDPATGTLFLLEGKRPRIVRATPGPDGGYTGLTAIALRRALGPAGGIAFDPSTGHLHLIDAAGRNLYEMTTTGSIIATRDLSPLGLGPVRSMTFAPSRDETDDPGRHHLFVVHVARGAQDRLSRERADRGTTDPAPEGTGEIVELTFDALVAPPAAAFTSALVRTTRTSDWNPPSPDSAGVVYLPASGRLLVSDSEVNEMSIFEGVNLFESSLSGTLIDTYTTTSFSDEPTGVSVNPANGHLFISDDTGTRSVYQLNPGSDGRYDTSDDSVTSFPTGSFGSNDPEGVTYAVGLNVLFVVDGVNEEIYRVTLSGNRQSNFDTGRHGLSDPEGIAYNSDTGNLYAVGKPEDTLFEFTTSGSLVQTIDISAANADKPAGLAYGPRSNGSGKSIYIVARGVDNDSNSRENDGRMYEMTLPDSPTVNLPPVANDDTAGTAEGTPVTIDVAANDVDPDGNLDRNSASTSCGGCSLPADGSLSNNGNGLFTYTPDGGFLGEDGFVYQICDTDNACDTAGVTIIVSNSQTLSIRVAASSDDAEEDLSGSMSLTSSDLEMTFDGETQKVGMRFNGVAVPQGTDITNAYIQFTVDETSADLTTLTIRGQNSNNAATFSSTGGDVSARPLTSASVGWSPPAWNNTGDDGSAQRTPDISSIVEQIVGRSGWASGNSLVIIITGTGKRTAEAYDGEAGAAPLLVIEYGSGGSNATPVAANDGYAVTEDGFLNVPAPGVLGNDSDPDGDPITAVLLSDVSDGALNLSSNGSFTYAPDPDFAGGDSFTYRASDGQANSAPATVTITVNPVNDPPSAVGESYAMDANTSLVVPAPGVLGNDSDPDGDPITAALVSGVGNGSLALNANGSFTYTPTPGFLGADSFMYEARDAALSSNSVTVSIDVLRVNTAPVAADNTYGTNEDTQLVVAAPGVLGNDGDADGDPLTAVLASGPSHGVLTLNANGSFSYTPAANYNGGDAFTYRANDGRDDSNLATVSINTAPVNDPPSASNDSYTTPAETRLTVAAPGVLGNDGDVDGDPLTAILVAGPSSGALTFNPNGSFTYDPNPLFTGTDSFTYRSHDGAAASAPATVTITVQQPPIEVTGIAPPSMPAGGDIVVTISGVSFQPGATVSFEAGSGPSPSASGVAVAADGRSLTADVSAKGGGPPRPRLWSVRVTNPDGSSAVLPDSFTVTP